MKAHQGSDKTWTFAVTLKHADTGWDHYANEWQVIAPDNKILATRTLYHPHVDEQPFTRNTSGVKFLTAWSLLESSRRTQCMVLPKQRCRSS